MERTADNLLSEGRGRVLYLVVGAMTGGFFILNLWIVGGESAQCHRGANVLWSADKAHAVCATNDPVPFLKAMRK